MIIPQSPDVTAFFETFSVQVPMYLRNAAAAILVYDISSRESFIDVDKWLIGE